MGDRWYSQQKGYKGVASNNKEKMSKNDYIAYIERSSNSEFSSLRYCRLNTLKIIAKFLENST